MDNSWSVGKNIGSSTGNYFKTDLDNTISNPMTTDQKISTVDGSKTGDAKLICSEGDTKEYLTIGYTGTDNISISVLLDKDLDGTKETSWAFNGVSGICSDGVVKCSPNTWGDSCKYYKWDFPSNILSLNQTVYAGLNNCYCINGSCGNLAGTAKIKILDDLGGTISSLISSSSSDFIITKGSNNGISVNYWGQDYSNCSNDSGSSNISSSDVDNIDGEVNSQLNNKNSAYYVLNESTQNDTELESDFKNNLTTRTTTTLNSANSDSSSNYSYKDGSKNINGSIFYKNDEQAKYCEVSWEASNTASFSDNTNRNTSTSNSTMTTTEIRECTDNWTICPIKEGETIKHNCGAIDNFAEVAATLSAVDEATKDMVCSSLN